MAGLVISAGLPFALGRFCTTEGLINVTALAMMRGRGFMREDGAAIAAVLLWIDRVCRRRAG